MSRFWLYYQSKSYSIFHRLLFCQNKSALLKTDAMTCLEANEQYCVTTWNPIFINQLQVKTPSFAKNPENNVLRIIT